MNEELRRSIILDNYSNPNNRGLTEDSSYIRINTNNESCIDNIDLMIKLDNNVVKDIRFDGEACVICISSTSIMTKLLIGKTKEEALRIIENYQNMINELPYDEKLLEEANAYNEIYKQPSRKKCATLTWNGMNEVLNKK